MNIVIRLGAYFGSLAWDRATGKEDAPERLRLRAQQLRDMLTALGPSFIKVGLALLGWGLGLGLKLGVGVGVWQQAEAMQSSWL